MGEDADVGADALHNRLGALGARLTALEFSERAGANADAEADADALVVEARDLAAEAAASTEAAGSTSTSVVQGTPCVGPCLCLWEGASGNKTVRALVRRMFNVDNVSDARAMYNEVMQLKPPGAAQAPRYRVCRLTGYPCSALGGATTAEASELHRECVRMSQYAYHVAAQVRERVRVR